MRTVLVTTLHEHERAFADQHVKALASGERWIRGTADQAGIDALEKQCILVEVLADADDLAAEGFIADSALEAFTGEVPETPADIELAANGPIQPEWLDDLRNFGHETVTRSGGDRLVLHVEDAARLQAIAALDWVVGVRALTAAPRVKSWAAVAGEEDAADTMALWDVRLDKPSQGDEVVAWATKNGFERVGRSDRRVRLRGLRDREYELGALRPLRYQEYIEPELHNDVARADIGSTAAAQILFAGTTLALTGKGQTVGVADSGIDETHSDFAGRILKVFARARPSSDATDPHGHGTHVAGTILGDGKASNGTYAGVAPGAQLVFQSVLSTTGKLAGLPLDLGDLFDEAYAAGARIHNNSWGSQAQGRYTSTSEDVDAFVVAKPDMLIVISAGNEGSTRVDPELPVRLEPGRVQPLSVTAPATSKNALVVGAVRSSRTTGGLSGSTYGAAFKKQFPLASVAGDVAAEAVSGNPEQLAAFSSRGPCDDRRIKPDVVAPGTDIISARSALATDPKKFWALVDGQPYGYMGGTSMAAPVVSGLAALVREYFVSHRGVTDPSAALLKATIINGTRVLRGGDAGGPVPNPHQGFGCVHLPTTLPSGPELRLAFVDVPASAGFTGVMQLRRFRFTTTKDAPLRICMAFADPASRGLQNDLDLIVEMPGFPSKKVLGNADLRGRLTKEDSENNVEIARFETAPKGDWVIAILCRNLLHGPQGFAVVALGALADDALVAS